MPDGWLDGEGRAVSKEALQTAEAFLFMVLDAGVPRPGVYPTPDGGIQMEWAEGPEELEVLVANGGSIRIYFDDEEPDGFVGTPALFHSCFTRHALHPAINPHRATDPEETDHA